MPPLTTLARPAPLRRVAAPPRGAAPRAPGNALGFALFLVVTATLFVRPAEFVPELLGLPIYQTLIISCLAVSFTCVLRQFQPHYLLTHPLSVCVLGLLPAVVLSHLAQGNLEGATESGWEFFKVLVYYLLLAGLLTTPGRLRVFLLFFTVCATVLALIALLQFHEVINLATLAGLKDRHTDAATGLTVVFVRLGGTGIFKDPNDMCLVLVLALPLGLYWLTDRRLGPARFVWLGPLLVLGYTLFLTRSRGGFLAFVIGVLVLLWARFGWKKAAGLAALTLPALLFLFGGRQTDLSSQENTGLQRIQLWSDALLELRHAPLFGIGCNKFQEQAGLVTHNSYLHSFAELGLLGGTLFLGAFYLMLARLVQLSRSDLRIVNPELSRLRPFLFAALAGYAGALLTLSNSYTVPTYMVLGLGVTFAELTQTRPTLPSFRLDGRLLKHLLVASVAFLLMAYVFVRLTVRW